jgi:hypothetical protein
MNEIGFILTFQLEIYHQYKTNFGLFFQQKLPQETLKGEIYRPPLSNNPIKIFQHKTKSYLIPTFLANSVIL